MESGFQRPPYTNTRVTIFLQITYKHYIIYIYVPTCYEPFTMLKNLGSPSELEIGFDCVYHTSGFSPGNIRINWLTQFRQFEAGIDFWLIISDLRI